MFLGILNKIRTSMKSRIIDVNLTIIADARIKTDFDIRTMVKNKTRDTKKAWDNT